MFFDLLSTILKKMSYPAFMRITVDSDGSESRPFLKTLGDVSVIENTVLSIRETLILPIYGNKKYKEYGFYKRMIALRKLIRARKIPQPKTIIVLTNYWIHDDMDAKLKQLNSLFLKGIEVKFYLVNDSGYGLVELNQWLR